VALNGSGVMIIDSTGQPVIANTLISASVFNAFTADVAAALSTALYKDGQQTITANIPMGGFKLTGLAAGSSNGDSVRFQQLPSATNLLPVASGGTGSGTAADARAALAVLGTAGGNMTGGINGARSSVTQHATTMDLFATTVGEIIDGTGSAVTITACVNAPQAGAVRKFYPLVNTVLTHGATFDIDGNANVTAAAGDCWEIEAKTTSTYKVHVWNEAAVPAIVAQATAEAGTDTVPRLWTAERVAQAIAALGGSGITLGTPVASTSGTSIDFTSIPAGTKRITINLAGVSLSGSSDPLFQIGDSGGVETTGYLGGSCRIIAATPATANNTAGFVVNYGNSANILHGTLILSLENASTNTWLAIGVFATSNAAASIYSAGSKSLSAELDRVRITTTGGSDTFDAGEINIIYES